MIAGYWGTVTDPDANVIERNLGENGVDINRDGQFTVVQTPVMLLKKNTLGTLQIQATVTSY